MPRSKLKNSKLNRNNTHRASKLRNKCNIKIAAGENACTFWDFKKMIDTKAVNFSQPSVIKVGGISEMYKIINRL